MNITVKDGVKSLQPVFKGTYMEMQTQKLTEIPKDSLSPLQVKKLYTFDNLRFVINNIANGIVIKETAPKDEQEMHPYDALTIKS